MTGARLTLRRLVFLKAQGVKGPYFLPSLMMRSFETSGNTDPAAERQTPHELISQYHQYEIRKSINKHHVHLLTHDKRCDSEVLSSTCYEQKLAYENNTAR